MIYRVFTLKAGLETGTVFANGEEGREYLVIARHITCSLRRKCQDGGPDEDEEAAVKCTRAFLVYPP